MEFGIIIQSPIFPWDRESDPDAEHNSLMLDIEEFALDDRERRGVVSAERRDQRTGGVVNDRILRAGAEISSLVKGRENKSELRAREVCFQLPKTISRTRTGRLLDIFFSVGH